MKKLVIVLAVIAMAFAMSSCKKNGGATPTDATKSYYEMLKKEDFKGAVKSTYKYNKEMTADEKKKAEEAPKAPPEPTKEEVLLTEIRDLLKESNK